MPGLSERLSIVLKEIAHELKTIHSVFIVESKSGMLISSYVKDNSDKKLLDFDINAASSTEIYKSVLRMLNLMKAGDLKEFVITSSNFIFVFDPLLKGELFLMIAMENILECGESVSVERLKNLETILERFV